MPRLNQTTIVLALGIWIVSLVVTIAIVLYVVSTWQSGSVPMQQVTIPKPRPLTPDNPASALPNAQGLHVLGGAVVRMSASEIFFGGDQGEQRISLNANTRYYRQSKQKDPIAYQKEMGVFQETLRSAIGATETFIAPSAYEMVEGSLSDFTPGTQVRVFVGADEVAVQVVILSGSGPQR